MVKCLGLGFGLGFEFGFTLTQLKGVCFGAVALEQAVPCKRVGMAVVGLEVPHAHVHLIPIHQMTDMSFQTKVKMQEEDFISLVNKIRSKI